jgi:hypothetical protein
VKTLNSPTDIEKIHSRLFNLGLVLNVFTPMVLIVLGGLVMTRGIDVGTMKDLELFFWVLIAVALSEIPAIYLVKKTLLSRGKPSMRESESVTAEQTLYRVGIIIFSLSLAPSIYGLVYYLLGGTFERFVLFAALTLFCFILFKPKLEEVSSFIKKQVNTEENEKEL